MELTLTQEEIGIAVSHYLNQKLQTNLPITVDLSNLDPRDILITIAENSEAATEVSERVDTDISRSAETRSGWWNQFRNNTEVDNETRF